MYHRDSLRDRYATTTTSRDAAPEPPTPGKRTLVEGLPRAIVAAAATLGHDVSRVTVHQDGEAAALRTRAFARGNQIHFASGAYQPATLEGILLICHEILHIIQQREGRAPATGEIGGKAVNRDPALEAEADAGAASLAAKVDPAALAAPDAEPAVESGPSAAPAAPVVQGSDLPAPTTDAGPDSSEADSSEADSSEADPDLALDEVMGEGYEAGRDAAEDDYWTAYGDIDAALGFVAAQDAVEAGRITAEMAASDPLFDEIRACEEAVVDTAQRGADGKLIRDEVAVADLEAARSELDDYTALFLAEAKLWSLVRTVPFLEGLEGMIAGWVKLLRDADERAAIAMKSYWKIKAMMEKYQEEFDEAKAKVAVDGLSVIGDVLLLAGPLTGAPAFIAGASIGIAGVAAGFAIEPGEKTQALSVFNGALTSADMARTFTEWKTNNSGAVVSMELSKKLSGVGLAIDVWSTFKDATEAGQHAKMLSDIEGALRDWRATWGELVAVWPSVCTALHAALPYLESLRKVMAGAMPAIEAAQAEIDGLRVGLGPKPH